MDRPLHLPEAFYILLIFLLVLIVLVQYSEKKRREIAVKSGASAARFQRLLNEFRASLLLLMNTEELVSILCNVIETAFPRARYYVFLWEDQYGAYVPSGMQNPPSSLRFRVYDEFLLWIGEHERPYLTEEIRAMLRTKEQKEAFENFIISTGADIVTPFALNKSILSLLALKLPEGQEEFSEEELHFLYELQGTASIAFSNAVLYERLKGLNENLEEKVKERTRELEEAQALLVQSEKFAGIGVMVAGIAHEINTPAAVIQGAIENTWKNIGDFIKRTMEHHPDADENTISLANTIIARKAGRHLDSAERFRKTRNIRKVLIEQHGLEAADADLRTKFVLDNFLEEDLSTIATLKPSQVLLLTTLAQLIRNLRNIHASIQSIVRIVRALKYYSRIDAPEKDMAELKEGMENTLIILHNQLKHGFQIETDFAKLPPIQCYPGELNQVWTNLIANAVQSMGEKGHLTIKTGEILLQSPPTPGQVVNEETLRNLAAKSGSEGTRYQYVTIEDNGPGIESSIQTKIFDPFFTTKGPQEGTGLGLGIVRNIVRKHDGFLSLFSQPGETRFGVYIPAE